jgi:hypothetical protein
MKKTLIILPLFALITVSCTQATKKQVENSQTEPVQQNEQTEIVDLDPDKIREEQKITSVLRFKERVKMGKDILSEYVNYPLGEINNRQEFSERYEEIFDEALQKIILKSTPNDWIALIEGGILLRNDRIAAREGITILNDRLLVQLDDDGNLDYLVWQDNKYNKINSQ